MKKSAIILAGVCLLAATSLRPAVADSGPFSDVSADHWAYRSIDALQKDGVVIGYPNGTYGGRRAMTRYEFAVAIARLIPMLNTGGDTNYWHKDSDDALKRNIEENLQSDVGALEALRKLVDEFTPELQKIGQNVAGAKDELDMLEARVAVIEEEQRRIRFTGALSLIAEGDAVTQGKQFIDENGSPIGIDNYLLHSTFVSDLLLDVRGRVSHDTTANIRLDFGNYLSAIGNTVAPGYSAGGSFPTPLRLTTLNARNEQTTVWEANVVAGSHLGRIGGTSVTVGRFGNEWTPYTLAQIDADAYTNLIQTDRGEIPIDGGKVEVENGRVDIQGWAGQMKAIPLAEPWGGPAAAGQSQLGTRPTGLIPSTHATALFQGDGLRATYGHADSGEFGVTIENFATAHGVVDPNANAKYSVLAVYGLDYTGVCPVIKSGIKLMASITDAATSTSSRAVNDVGNGWRYVAFDTQAGRQFGQLWLQGGYRYIGPEFSAPGSWGRLGAWINPTNVEGAVGSAMFDVTRDLHITGDIAAYHAAYGGLEKGGVINSPLRQDDRLINFKVSLDYTCTAGYDTSIAFEQSNYDLKNRAGTLTNPGKPSEGLLTIGIGHTISKNSSVRLIYQYDSYADKNTGFGGFDSAGNVVATQLTAKF